MSTSVSVAITPRARMASPDSSSSNGNGGSVSLKSGCLPGRPCAGSRPLLAGGRPTPRARHGVCRARPGAPVLLAIRRTVANRDGSIYRCSRSGTPDAFYGESSSRPGPTPERASPTLRRCRRFSPAIRETAGSALKVIKSQPASSGFGDSTFHGLNAFRSINAASESTPVRWILTPAQPLKRQGRSRSVSLRTRTPSVRRAFDRTDSPPAVAVVSHRHRRPGQATRPTTPPLHSGRRDGNRSTSACALIARPSREVTTPEKCRAPDINFDPLVLPAGIVRRRTIQSCCAWSAVYSQSYTRRVGEQKQPGAITPAEVEKGE